MMDPRTLYQAEIAAARLHGLCQIADDLLKDVEHGGEVPRWANHLDALHQTLVREAAALLDMIEGLSRDGHRLAADAKADAAGRAA